MFVLLTLQRFYAIIALADPLYGGVHAMNLEARDALREVGSLLDQNRYKQFRVYKHGIVSPCSEPALLTTQKEEQEDETQRSRGSTARPRKWAPGRQRSTIRSWAARSAPQVICPELKDQYESELSSVRDTYPGTKVLAQKKGLWLLAESLLLPNNWQKAKLLIWLPFIRTESVRSWGFWDAPPLNAPVWIGPRHTNFPDGSICAFEQSDGTWFLGDPIVNLLDFYSLWCLRQLHLQELGRWPGRQVAVHAFERLSELREDEFCGCAESGKLYGECCHQRDLLGDKVASLEMFHREVGVAARKPPKDVVDFIREQITLPSIQ